MSHGRAAIAAMIVLIPLLHAQADAPFHDAPPSATHLVNPYAAQTNAVGAGASLYAEHCAACHGAHAEGTGNIPALGHSAVQGSTGWRALLVHHHRQRE